MTLLELRIELSDHPGALSAVTRELARLRMNVVEVAIHEVDGSSAVDEIVVSAPDGAAADQVRRALAAAGADLLSLRTCEVRIDPVVATATWLGEALDRPEDLATFGRGLKAGTGIAHLDIVPATVAQGSDVGLAALRRGRPVVRRVETVPEFVTAPGAGARWLLAAPDRREGELVVFAARPFAVRFTATELRRLSALIDCRSQLVARATGTTPARAAWSVALSANA